MAKKAKVPAFNVELIDRLRRVIDDEIKRRADTSEASTSNISWSLAISKYQVYFHNQTSPYPGTAGYTTDTQVIVGGLCSDQDGNITPAVAYLTAADTDAQPPQPGIFEYEDVRLMWVNYRPQQMTEILRLLQKEGQPLSIFYAETNSIRNAFLCTPDTPYPVRAR